MNDRIQFCHDRAVKNDRPFEGEPGYFHFEINPKGGRTIAVEVPTIEEFAVLSPSLKNPVPVKIGIAVCSKKDLYNKKVGRELSVSRMKEVNFYVTKSEHNPGYVYGPSRTLHLYNSELHITIQLTLYGYAKRVYFEGVV